MQGGVLVEDGRAVEKTDAPDGASQHGVVMGCGRQGSREREEGIAGYLAELA